MVIKMVKRLTPLPVKLRIRKILNIKNTSIIVEDSIDKKIQLFIERNKDRSLPDREKKFLPEILVPCFNHGKFLEYLLNAIEGKEIPITIINDKSTDDSAEIIKKLGNKYVFTNIVNEINLKQFGSLNKAISQSFNNLFIVINADDILIPNWIDYVIKSFESSDIYLLGGRSVSFNAMQEVNAFFSNIVRTIEYTPTKEFQILGPKDAIAFDHDNSIDMTMSGCSFLKSAWEFVGGFYPREKRVSIHDDRDFQMRVCSFFNIGITKEISAFWRNDSSQGKGL